LWDTHGIVPLLFHSFPVLSRGEDSNRFCNRFAFAALCIALHCTSAYQHKKEFLTTRLTTLSTFTTSMTSTTLMTNYDESFSPLLGDGTYTVRSAPFIRFIRLGGRYILIRIDISLGRFLLIIIFRSSCTAWTGLPSRHYPVRFVFCGSLCAFGTFNGGFLDTTHLDDCFSFVCSIMMRGGGRGFVVRGGLES
jgi:hypothetical protein